MADFVHLHVHSEFSLLDGLGKVKDLTQAAAEMGMPAVALTDHGVMFGILHFYQAAKKAGIKPIVGCEIYISPREMTQKDVKFDTRPTHLILLAEDQTGYDNLMQIATAAQLEGFYYKPRVDKEFLAAHAQGLIALSACGSGEVPRLLQNNRPQKARQAAEWYRDVFGPKNFFLELQDHDIPELEPVNRALVEMSRETGIPLVATNDAHYIRRDQAYAHEVLLCIQTGKTMTEPTRMRMNNDSYYLKNAEEMAALFPDLPEAMHNTVAIAERCNVNLDPSGFHLPEIDIPDGFTHETYLRHLTEDGLRRLYGDEFHSEPVQNRLDHELGIIHHMGFDIYFLIVWDLCQFSLQQDIWWNVRGSAAGSIVAYGLGITNLDPLAHELIFERLLNPGRVTMPDIDLDYPDDRREEMIEYTVQKYGADKVAQIITFGTLGAKAAIRDVGRALDIPLGEVDKVARLVPGGPGVKLDESLTKVAELRQLYEGLDYVRTLDRHCPRGGGRLAPRQHPRRRRSGHRQAAGGIHAPAPPHPRRGRGPARDPVHHGCAGRHRPAQGGLSGTEHPHRSAQGSGPDRGTSRRHLHSARLSHWTIQKPTSCWPAATCWAFSRWKAAASGGP